MNLTKTNNLEYSILIEITFTSEVGVQRLIHSLLVCLLTVMSDISSQYPSMLKEDSP